MERQLIAGACFLAALASWAPACHAQTPGVDYPYGDGVVYRREALFGSFAGGNQDGPALEFECFDSHRVRASASGNWYLLDEVNGLAIKKYDVAKNRISTIAWGGPYGKLGGIAEACRFAGGGYSNNMGLTVDGAERFLTVFDHSNGDIYWRMDLVTGMVDPAPGPTQAAGAAISGWGAGGVLYYAMDDGLLKKVLPDGTIQSLGVTLEQPLRIISFYNRVAVSEKMGRLYAFSRDFRDGPWGMVWYWDMTTGRGTFVAGPKPGETAGPLASGPANAVSFWGQGGLALGPDRGERYVYCGGGDEPTPSRVDLQRSYVYKLVKANAPDPSLWTWGDGKYQTDYKFLDPYNWSSIPGYNSENGEFYIPWNLASRVDVYRPLTGTVQPVTITIQPANQTVASGQTAAFSVVASGTAPLTYQWQKNGADIAGATGASFTTPATIAADNGALFRVIVTNSAGSVTSNAATLTVNAPVAPSITTHPSSQTVAVGQTATFSVVASGTTLSYQWQKNGVDIAGATSASYTTPATALADSGSTYRVVVTNAQGSATSNAATLTVTAAALPDVVVTSLSYAAGNFTCTVQNQGSAATPAGIVIGVLYSVDGSGKTWGAVNGPLAAGASVTIGTQGGAFVIPDGAHMIEAFVDDPNRFAESDETNNKLTQAITVGTGPTAPSITTQPTNQTVTAGQTATFSVAASGTAPLSYQWQRNGADIAGATSVSYTTPATDLADSGSTYRAVVTNAAGSVMSNAATLTVTAAPPPPASDSDGDGLPDSWEQTHFGGLIQTGDGDPDGDGATNLQEYQGGTDPVDPASRPATGLPLPWVHQDVGAVGAAGIASYATSVFTVQGSGEDVWNTADAFHFVYQTLSGDGEIVTRVSTQQNTNAWAKAGVMVRESLAAGSANAFIAVTPGNGVRFQYRFSTGNTTDAVAGTASTAPYWLKMVRAGTQLTGLASVDGTNWIAVGSQAVSIGTHVFVGLGVVSSVPNVLNTSTFDNVSVTAGGGGGADADGDGLPDAWEMTHFGNLSQVASGDPDGDGASNLDEFLAGTGPMDPNSVPGQGTGTAPAGGRDNPNGNGCIASVAASSGGGAWILALALFCGFLSCVPDPRQRRLSAGTKER